MQSIIQKFLKQAIDVVTNNPNGVDALTIPVEHSRTPQHGDFSSSVALSLAKTLHIAPVKLAQDITDALNKIIQTEETVIQEIEVVAPGFINFFIRSSAWLDTLSAILKEKDKYGTSNVGQQKRILMEFVSSNPTGPLHVGHGRAAVQGDVLARILKTIGYDVHTEYYINDAGRQMDILACSIWLRYLATIESTHFSFPSNAYQGTYIKNIATALKSDCGDIFYKKITDILKDLPPDAQAGGDKDHFIDSLIARMKSTLGQTHYQNLLQFGLTTILKDIREDLTEFGVNFDHWFSEKSLIDSDDLTKLIQQLKEADHTYHAEGHLWFRSTSFGDDKDRVLIRANGQPTYFAVDAAYRLNILKTRKFEKIINLLGADHHGYLGRIHAVIQALGYPKNHIIFSTLQMVSLYRGNQKLPLSTRSGEFITLRALRTEVGHDASRLFFILRKSTQAIDFDLKLAQSTSHQNPVYYLQYAYARISSVMGQLSAKGLSWDSEDGLKHIANLTLEEEIQLIKQLSQYPDVIKQAAIHYEPVLLVQYLRNLAKSFHSYYNSTPVLNQENAIRQARLTLIQATQQILRNGFILLGIQAHDRM